MDKIINWRHLKFWIQIKILTNLKCRLPNLQLEVKKVILNSIKYTIQRKKKKTPCKRTSRRWIPHRLAIEITWYSSDRIKWTTENCHYHRNGGSQRRPAALAIARKIGRARKAITASTPSPFLLHRLGENTILLSIISHSVFWFWVWTSNVW